MFKNPSLFNKQEKTPLYEADNLSMIKQYKEMS